MMLQRSELPDLCGPFDRLGAHRGKAHREPSDSGHETASLEAFYHHLSISVKRSMEH